MGRGNENRGGDTIITVYEVLRKKPFMEVPIDAPMTISIMDEDYKSHDVETLIFLAKCRALQVKVSGPLPAEMGFRYETEGISFAEGEGSYWKYQLPLEVTDWQVCAFQEGVNFIGKKGKTFRLFPPSGEYYATPGGLIMPIRGKNYATFHLEKWRIDKTLTPEETRVEYEKTIQGPYEKALKEFESRLAKERQFYTFEFWQLKLEEAAADIKNKAEQALEWLGSEEMVARSKFK